MNHLPPELLIEIFQHLSASDLINLSSISKKFNEIISRSEFSSKLTLNFRKNNQNNVENATTRQYRILRIGFYKIHVHSLILSEIGANLTELEFSFCKFKLDLMRKILMTCININKLKFLKALLTDVPNEPKLPLPSLLNLKLEVICSDPRIFRILYGCVVNSLQTDHKYKHATGDLDCFIKFLSYQDHLEELDLSDFYRTSLFNDNELDHVRFRLKILRLRNVNLAKTVHFKTFLENNCIECLEVRN